MSKNETTSLKNKYRFYVFIDLLITSLFAVIVINIFNLFFSKLSTLSIFLYIFVCFIASSLVSSFILYFTTKQSKKREQLLNIFLKKIADNDFDYQFDKTGNIFLDNEIESFNRILKELKSVAILKEDFISNFSHEFKTPITSIKGFAEVLQSKPELNENDKREYLQIIIDESTKLANLSKNTLLMSKLDSQITQDNKKVFLLDEQLRQSILMLDKEMSQKNINLEVDLKKINICASEEMLNHVWLNLLTNAIKFTNDEIGVSAFYDEKNIYVKVSDNGIGIDEKDINHIFEKYFQCDTSHKSVGNGLGLSICKKIVELLNGSITVESHINQGTTFTVVLPNELNK